MSARLRATTTEWLAMLVVPQLYNFNITSLGSAGQLNVFAIAGWP